MGHDGVLVLVSIDLGSRYCVGGMGHRSGLYPVLILIYCMRRNGVLGIFVLFITVLGHVQVLVSIIRDLVLLGKRIATLTWNKPYQLHSLFFYFCESDVGIRAGMIQEVQRFCFSSTSQLQGRIKKSF